MIKTLKALLLFLILGSAVLYGSYASAELPPLSLVEIEDGDTLVALVGNERMRLQLKGIDAPEDMANPKLARDAERTGLAPESLLPLGVLATTHLQNLVEPGEALRIDGELGQTDRYGRVPAVVIAPNGRILNRAMVEDGFAITLGEPLAAESPLQPLPTLEQTAIVEGRGLWGSHPEAAASWRGR